MRQSAFENRAYLANVILPKSSLYLDIDQGVTFSMYTPRSSCEYMYVSWIVWGCSNASGPSALPLFVLSPKGCFRMLLAPMQALSRVSMPPKPFRYILLLSDEYPCVRISAIFLCVFASFSGADPASQFDRCTIRLLKDHHSFSSVKCRDGGGVLYW